MEARIAVSSKIEDARARAILHTLKNRFPEGGILNIGRTDLYTVDAKLSEKDLNQASERLANPITERYSMSDVLAPTSYTYAIEIGYLPGVTDNVGRTAQETIEDCTEKKFKEGEAVYSSYVLFLSGEISREAVERIAGELHNPLIERASVFGAGENIPIVVPRVDLQEDAQAEEVNLEVSDKELETISREGIAGADGTRRGPLALSPEAMKAIRDHFRTLKRNPTDVELEALAQTWSEHCKHTIFADPLDEVKEGIYKRYIKGATEKIRKQKGRKDFCVSVFKDNSGAIAFDKDWLVTHKVETHNSPSGLDPFGGSVTAIGGVNRDCLGFGLGAKPIANTYGFCVADPEDTRELFRDAEKKQPLLSSRRILEGVVAGINAGGNQSGIPTPLGFVAVDESYRGKPLVFGGTIGLIPRKHGKRKLYEKKAEPGDHIVMIGGRVGLDGIHGATFSSEALSKGSPATAVQIGDPITQKKLSDALIREARDAGLYNSITDMGAGGLSGAVGEMSREAGGCVVDLENVPLKYPGLAPWQIWISESQERMVLAVPRNKWNAFKRIMDRYDVETTRIGEFTDSGSCVVRNKEVVVMDIALDFLHDGRPITKQKSAKTNDHKEAELSASKQSLEKDFLELLAQPSVGSIECISRQYDYEVQGMSVTKPLVGKGRVNADAGVMQPLSDSSRGIVLSHGYAPWYSAVDTEKMAAAAIDTAVRNAVCAGASLEYLAILDNFCWSSSDTPERLYELKQAAKACYDVAVAYGTPFISGKDSMFNDFRGYDAHGNPIHIAALPTLLVSALGVIPDVEKAMTIDLKNSGDALYLLGETNDELGCSGYAHMLATSDGVVPHVNTKQNAKVYNVVSQAIEKEIVASATPVGRGGLSVALAKSAIAGQRGISVDLSEVSGDAQSPEEILFSESQGRVLLSVREGKEKEFEKLAKVSCARIGEATDGAFSITIGKKKLEYPLLELTSCYRSFFKLW